MDAAAAGPALFELRTGDGSSPTTGRLSYHLSGPGTGPEWAPVPLVAAAEWTDTVRNATTEVTTGAGTGGDDVVWGIKLDDLEDAEYRVEVSACDPSG